MSIVPFDFAHPPASGHYCLREDRFLVGHAADQEFKTRGEACRFAARFLKRTFGSVAARWRRLRDGKVKLQVVEVYDVLARRKPS